MQRTFLPLTIAFAIMANAAPTDDRTLFTQALSREALHERLCRGMPSEKVGELYEKKYRPRQDRLAAAIKARYGPDYVYTGNVILMGRPCPYYRGAETRLRKALAEAEKRLGLGRR